LTEEEGEPRISGESGQNPHLDLGVVSGQEDGSLWGGREGGREGVSVRYMLVARICREASSL
jgi:hypothetical protein